jgi:hypothetical protein
MVRDDVGCENETPYPLPTILRSGNSKEPPWVCWAFQWTDEKLVGGDVRFYLMTSRGLFARLWFRVQRKN